MKKRYAVTIFISSVLLIAAALPAKERPRVSMTQECAAFAARATEHLQKANTETGLEMERLVEENAALKQRVKNLERDFFRVFDLNMRLIVEQRERENYIIEMREHYRRVLLRVREWAIMMHYVFKDRAGRGE